MPNSPNATTLATAYATSRSSASIAGAVETMAVTPQMLVPAAISVPSRGGRPEPPVEPGDEDDPGCHRREHDRAAPRGRGARRRTR